MSALATESGTESRTHTVGIGECILSTHPRDVLVTYALGSCLGIAVYDPEVGVGGLLHAMLPESRNDPERAKRNPYLFVDTGVAHLFRQCYAQGAVKERIVFMVAGGSAMMNVHEESLQIGKRNLAMLRKLLWFNGVMVRASDTGGHHPRSMKLHMHDGSVYIREHNDWTRLG